MKQAENTNIPQIGEGIFLTKDVSYILNLPYSKVRHWLNEFWDKEFVSDVNEYYSFGDKKNKAIDFYTFIEFHTFYELRKHGVSAQKIRKAHQTISTSLKTKHPFAIAGISHDRNKIWYEHLEALINADGSKQINIKPILDPFLLKIDYNQNNLAERFYPDGKKHNVVVDPHHQFGQPTIIGTNIKTETIYNLYKGGEKKSDICLMYDLSKKQVSDVILFYTKRAAA